MKILVTGATGFVGSWIARALVERGHQIRVLRRENSDLSELTGLNVEHTIGDVTDPSSLPMAFKDIDSVFHLAGFVGYSKAQRPMMDLVNVQGTKNIVKACLQFKVKKLIHFSSVVAIGGGFSKNDILNEKSSYNIHHLNLGYFETKKQAEDIVLQAVKSQGLMATIVNPSTIYGPGDAKKGSRKIQLKVAKGQFPFYTGGGVNVISIHDVVQGTLAAWERGGVGERYILAGENILIHDLFRMIAESAGVEPPKIKLPDFLVHFIGKIGDQLEARGKKGPLNSENAWTSTMFHWFDSSKAQKELGLAPRPAKEAIGASVDWIKEHGLLLK